MATFLVTARVIAKGRVRTYDMSDKDCTLDLAKAIAEYASLGTGALLICFLK